MTSALALPLLRLRRATRAGRPSERILDLSAGQRRDVALGARDGLRVLSGEVVLMRPPRWLAQGLVAPSAIVLREGDAWASVERETVTLLGSATARVAVGR